MILKVARNVLPGSRGSESAGKADHEHVLALAVLGGVEVFDIGEAFIKLAGGNLFTNLGGEGEWLAEGTSGGHGGRSGGDRHGEELHVDIKKF